MSAFPQISFANSYAGGQAYGSLSGNGAFTADAQSDYRFDVSGSRIADVVVAQNPQSDGPGGIGYFGQSFTIDGTGGFTDLTVNLYNEDESAAAPGTLYLFDAPYGGTPDALSASAANLIGSAAGIAGRYRFGDGVSLLGGATYYAYANGLAGCLLTGFDNPYTGGQAYGSLNGNSTFAALPSGDLRFRAAAVAVADPAAAIPEPASWAMLILGFLTLGAALRAGRGRGAAAALRC